MQALGWVWVRQLLETILVVRGLPLDRVVLKLLGQHVLLCQNSWNHNARALRACYGVLFIIEGANLDNKF